MLQNVLQGMNVTRCQFFLVGLYAIKIVVVAYWLLVFNVHSYEIKKKINSTHFLAQNIYFKRDLILDHTSRLFAKYDFCWIVHLVRKSNLQSLSCYHKSMVVTSGSGMLIES